MDVRSEQRERRNLRRYNLIKAGEFHWKFDTYLPLVRAGRRRTEMKVRLDGVLVLVSYYSYRSLAAYGPKVMLVPRPKTSGSATWLGSSD